MTPVIELKNLSHIYSIGTPFEHRALNDVSLSIYSGEFIGIIGKTGSGKSTLIQHLNALLQPTSGKVLLHGNDINLSADAQKDARFHVGLVFQYPEYQLFEETAYKDIAFGPSNMGLSSEEIHSRVLYAAGFVGISEELLEKSPFELSGGQKRKIAIAGVIAMKPDVLILDEPTAGLDPRSASDLMEHLQQYRKVTNATVIMVSHNMDEIAKNADRVVVMYEGSVFLDGTVEDVFIAADTINAIGLDLPVITQLFIELRRRGLPVDSDVYTLQRAYETLMALNGGNREC